MLRLTLLRVKMHGLRLKGRRLYRRALKSKKHVLTIEIDIYDDGEMAFISTSKPGDFAQVRNAMAMAIKKLQQQMRDQRECPFHPTNYLFDKERMTEIRAATKLGGDIVNPVLEVPDKGREEVVG